MQVNRHQERPNIDSKIYEAEVYYNMGLLSASLDTYEQILPLLDNQDAVKRDCVRKQIFQLRADRLGLSAKYMGTFCAGLRPIAIQQLRRGPFGRRREHSSRVPCTARTP